MNASSAIGAAVVLFSLAAVPAMALTAQPQTFGLGSNALISNVDFVQGHEVVAGVPARQAARAEMSKAMAERYFDVDMIVTVGALALASGAFVAAGVAGGRRRASEKAGQPRDGWRDEVMQALEADLAQFTVGLRQAA
jgi:hypothetical protein